MISWLGHLERMEEDRMPKKIFTQELEETRRKGRSRKGWREGVERDLQVMAVRRWRGLVTDRTKWRDIVRQAKAHNGLQRQRKKKKDQSMLCASLLLSFWMQLVHFWRLTVVSRIARHLDLCIENLHSFSFHLEDLNTEILGSATHLMQPKWKLLQAMTTRSQLNISQIHNHKWLLPEFMIN